MMSQKHKKTCVKTSFCNGVQEKLAIIAEVECH